MMYELAWCYRVQGNAETDAARLKLQHDAVEKVKSHWPKDQRRRRRHWARRKFR